MAIQTVYYRHKTRWWMALSPHWALAADPKPPRMAPISSGSVTPLESTNGIKHETEAAAKEAAKLAPVARQASGTGSDR